MEPNEDDIRRAVQTIDATPLFYVPISDLYEALAQLPRRSSAYEFSVKVIRLVAAELTLQAALTDASGVNRFKTYLDPDDARERSRDLLEVLNRLESEAGKDS